MSFRGRVCVITGGASGIGRALAVELAERGADIAICDVDGEGLEETARLVERVGREVSHAIVDVSDRAAIEAFREQVLEAHGRVDAIVNNAGVSLSQSVNEMTYEDLEWIIGINLWGVIYGTKAFLPDLLACDDGWVVNLSSVFGIISVPYQSAYNATKFAVRGFTEALRAELHETGVTALTVHPGGIKTNIVRKGRIRATPDGVDKDEVVETFDRDMARTSAEDAAKTIANAMAAREPRVLVGPDAKVIDVVQRMLPVRYQDVARTAQNRLRKR